MSQQADQGMPVTKLSRAVIDTKDGGTIEIGRSLQIARPLGNGIMMFAFHEEGDDGDVEHIIFSDTVKHVRLYPSKVLEPV